MFQVFFSQHANDFTGNQFFWCCNCKIKYSFCSVIDTKICFWFYQKVIVNQIDSSLCSESNRSKITRRRSTAPYPIPLFKYNHRSYRKHLKRSNAYLCLRDVFLRQNQPRKSHMVNQHNMNQKPCNRISW